MKRILIFSLSIFSLSLVYGQGFSGGFKAGLNFNTFEGETEGDFEAFNRTTGFHVGATFAYAFTDLIGVKADLMYSQKGVQQDYDGPSFFFLYGDNSEEAIGANSRRSELDVVNSYLDIPLMAYYRLGPLEIAGGASAGILLSSVGSGGTTYRNINNFNNDFELVFNYEGNFFRDGFGPDAILTRADAPLPGGGIAPPELIGAYYNSDSDEALFRRLDFGLVAEASFYFNSGLYVGGRYNFGLTDVTRAENDLAYQLDDNGNRQFRDDNDRNRSIQVSIGFRF